MVLYVPILYNCTISNGSQSAAEDSDLISSVQLQLCSYSPISLNYLLLHLLTHPLILSPSFIPSPPHSSLNLSLGLLYHHRLARPVVFVASALGELAAQGREID